MQPPLVFDVAGAFVIPSVVGDEQVVVDAPIEVHTCRPRDQIAYVAVQEENDAAWIRLLEMQRVQRRALDGDPHFLEGLIELETVVGRQCRRRKNYSLLLHVKQAQGAGIAERGQRGEGHRSSTQPTGQESRHRFAYTR